MARSGVSPDRAAVVRVEEVHPTEIDGDLDGVALMDPRARAQSGHEHGAARVADAGTEVRRAGVAGELLCVVGDHGRDIDAYVGEQIRTECLGEVDVGAKVRAVRVAAAIGRSGERGVAEVLGTDADGDLPIEIASETGALGERRLGYGQCLV